MGRRISAAVVVVLLGVLAGCADPGPAQEPMPVTTSPTSFDVPDPAHDAESTADGLVQPPNVDLVGISAAVGYDGVRVVLRYAQAWTDDPPARWGTRFELIGSDGSKISGAWTFDPFSTGPSRGVRLVPAPAGCVGSAQLDDDGHRLTLDLSPGCLPAVTRAEPRPWVRFDSLEAITSWHDDERILYGWDQLYARVVAPEPERLYLPD